MRTPRRRYAGPQKAFLPQGRHDAPIHDNEGREWNPELYRVNEDGSPLLTSAGNFWLKPGKSHDD